MCTVPTVVRMPYFYCGVHYVNSNWRSLLTNSWTTSNWTITIYSPINKMYDTSDASDSWNCRCGEVGLREFKVWWFSLEGWHGKDMNWIRIYDVCFLWFVCTMKLLSIKQFCWPTKLSSNRLISSAPRQSTLLETFSWKTQFKPRKHISYKTYIYRHSKKFYTFPKAVCLSSLYLRWKITWISGNFEPYSPEIAYAKEPYATTCISRYSLSIALCYLYKDICISYLCVLLDCLDLHGMRESQTSQFQLKLANENNINNNRNK